ncbi:RNA methyltransferase [Methylophilus aquaticus]|uniref:tRNA (cytidine/uridine-2'-O-)-methyltransferase TrmJ n=1 Tax=Methylophilus aquaticus TaxID=1971610 RepID=A0ABT9JRK4_9PROT|nr:RNA methyltransferase [Methylophilus aquaticus]MDP8567212.1 RNA methyltransferase [Methylophilus aquaticus]
MTSLFDNIRVVLCHTSHPGNIGSTARAMKTMGLHRLYLVNPKFFPDAQATSLAVNASDVLEHAMVTDSLEQALADCQFVIGVSGKERSLSQQVMTVREAAQEVKTMASHSQVALVFGTEMSGLSNAEADRCHVLATIPANPEYTSLNLAQAVQIMAYEVRMALTTGELHYSEKPVELATQEDLERLYEHMREVLEHIGYINPRAPKKLFERLRRLYGRTRLEKEEVNLLRGILTLTVSPKKHSKY